jgi:hypothetical protein
MNYYREPHYGIGTNHPISVLNCNTSAIPPVDNPVPNKNKDVVGMIYSTKVHVAAWATMSFGIVAICLSLIGAVVNNKSIGIISAFSMAICGIALIIWIESARRERNPH